MTRHERVGVRTVDLTRPLQGLADITAFDRVRVYATLGDRLLGFADLANRRSEIGAARLREALVAALGVKPLAVIAGLAEPETWLRAAEALSERLLPGGPAAADDGERLRLDPSLSASVVVATMDRPEDLRECLRCLHALETPRALEIVVVDNHPASGLTAPVVAEHSDVVLVAEPRQGLAYARNAGILAASGDIVVMTDDDVRVPSDWLEKLLGPFSRGDVAAVTGNVLPAELGTAAQRMFEAYGGLGRGFDRQVVEAAWFEGSRRAVPTWRLGASANAAFRAVIFRDPRIGLMLEALGPGMPSGVGEDTYLFYRLLKAGFTHVYEPDAFVWHRHRTDMRALRRQLYGYSKGHVAYHLTTLLRDGDLRALPYLCMHLPRGHMRRLRARLRGRIDYPLRLNALEIAGNIVAPYALWQSWRRVRQEGTSVPSGPGGAAPLKREESDAVQAEA